jgi:hypothetical protein
VQHRKAVGPNAGRGVVTPRPVNGRAGTSLSEMARPCNVCILAPHRNVPLGYIAGPFTEPPRSRILGSPPPLMSEGPPCGGPSRSTSCFIFGVLDGGLGHPTGYPRRGFQHGEVPHADILEVGLAIIPS